MMNKPSVVVVGSSNTDMVVTAPRIPAPGETILGGAFIEAAGGKGANQAVAAARLGASVTFVARVGLDVLGTAAITHYQNEGIDTSFIVQDEDARSGVALIIVDANGENAIAVASGANMRLSPEDVERAAPAIRRADVVMLQLEIPYETIQYTVNLATDAGIPILLNPAPARSLDMALLRKIKYLTPNESEAEGLTGIPVKDDTTANRAAHALLALGVETVILTRGASGVSWASEAGCGHVAAPRVQAVDTTAAGDAFNGGLAVAVAGGRDLSEALRFACQVGALAVTRLGAQPSLPTLQDLQNYYPVGYQRVQP